MISPYPRQAQSGRDSELPRLQMARGSASDSLFFLPSRVRREDRTAAPKARGPDRSAASEIRSSITMRICLKNGTIGISSDTSHFCSCNVCTDIIQLCLHGRGNLMKNKLPIEKAIEATKDRRIRYELAQQKKGLRRSCFYIKHRDRSEIRDLLAFLASHEGSFEQALKDFVGLRK